MGQAFDRNPGSAKRKQRAWQRLSDSGIGGLAGVGPNGSILISDSTQPGGTRWVVPVWKEVPTGAINGVNPAFTLAFVPIAGTEEIYVNGLQVQPGVGFDYTIAAGTITFLAGAIPETGDSIRVSYWK